MTVHVDATAVGYHYDPLDRLISVVPLSQARTEFFYCNDRLTSMSQGLIWRRILQHGSFLLAQERGQHFSLLVTDIQSSVLCVLNGGAVGAIAYSPYGYRASAGNSVSQLGFNGERVDEFTGHYFLGNGYRAFNPVLMRFNSPDSFSPFGGGGLNAYAYCTGDPVNKVDSSGHMSLSRFSRLAGSALGDTFVDPRDASAVPDLALIISNDARLGLNRIAMSAHDIRFASSTSASSTTIPFRDPVNLVNPGAAVVGPASLEVLSARQLRLVDIEFLSDLHPANPLANPGSLLRLKQVYMAAPSRFLLAQDINAGRVPGIEKAKLPVALQNEFSRIRRR